MQRLILLICSAVSAVLTGYILLSSYAVIYVQAMPFIDAMQVSQSTHLITSVAKATGTIISFSLPTSDNQQHLLQLLKAPKNNTRLNLSKAIERAQTWFERPSIGQYLFLMNRKTHQLEEVVVYTSEDWRTIPDAGPIAVGDNLFLQTDNQLEYMFRISEKVDIGSNDVYVPASSDKTALLLIVEQPQQHILHVFKADLVEVQGGTRQ